MTRTSLIMTPAPRAQWASSRGFTLLEILVALAIAALLFSLVLVAFPGDLSKLRRDTRQLSGTLKYLYNQAVLQNQYFRLGIDLDQKTYWVEASSEPFLVERLSEDDLKDLAKSAEAPPKPEEAGEATGTTVSSGFSQVTEDFIIEPKRLSEGIKFKDVFVYHAEAAQMTGKVYTYFLPGGWAEPLVINLSNNDETIFFSLELNPATGISEVRQSYFTPEANVFTPPASDASN